MNWPTGVCSTVAAATTAATDVADVGVPGTLQATLAARIDRLAPSAKRTLNAAAVIGLSFRLSFCTRWCSGLTVAGMLRPIWSIR